MVYNTSILTGYVDGVKSSISTATGGPIDSSFPENNLNFGRSPHSGSDWFNGIIEYGYLWDRDLSSAEIASLHREPYQMFTRPSVARRFAPQVVAPAGGGGVPTQIIGPIMTQRKGRERIKWVN